MKRLVTSFFVFLVLVCGSTVGAQELPGFSQDRAVMCSQEADGETVRIQCNRTTRRCLTASAYVRGSDGKPTGVFARMLNPCSTSEVGLRDRLVSQGYTMVPGRLETPHGYFRDERARLFQTHFDLMRRWYLGVGSAVSTPTFEDEWDATLYIESTARYERFDEYEERRNRHRFLVGALTLVPFELDAELYVYGRGRTGEEAPIWVTTFIGAPQRFDINIHVGPEVVVGRAMHREFGAVDQTVIDILEPALQWEIFQGPRMEDYLAIRTGIGGGLRFSGNDDAVFDAYPTVGLSAVWLAGARGLTEFRFDADYRRVWEPTDGSFWDKAQISASVERIVLAVNDQPLSLFVKPDFRWIRIDQDDIERADLRVLAGVRVSLFAPPKLPEDACPGEAEDYDGFEDEDGCLDPDNDADGVRDENDLCPLVPGPAEAGGCPQNR